VNYRLTITTAAAVILAAVSLYPLIAGIGWFWAGCGAVVIAALAGLATRLQPLPAAGVATGLALIAVYPLLASPHWYLGLTGLIIVAAAAASVTRWGLLPAAATLITYLASQLIYINLVFAPGASNAGVIPTMASLRHLGVLVSQGLGERIYAPPVPGRPGAVMLAAAGIGLMAVAADLISVRLRAPAIAGLPLLALFSVPITTSAKQGAVGAAVAFCLAITGYLAVLAADGRDRLRIWGRLVTLWQTGRSDDEQVRGPDTRALAASGRRIGLAAVCVAIFIPLLVPGLKIHKLFSGHGTASGGSGGHGVALPSPLVQLRGQLLPGRHVPVLTYSTNSADPASQYLQIYVLNFDPKAGTWTLPPSSGGVQVTKSPLPPAKGLAGSAVRDFTEHIRLSSGLTAGYTSGVSYLPVPYAPVKVSVDGSWSADTSTLMISSLDQHLAGLSYTATSQEVLPTTQELDAAGPPPSDVLRNYMLFPAPSDSPLRALAHRITKHASSPYDKAIAIQNWFTKPGRFTYTVGAGQPDTLAGLLRFLTVSRQGYCQQFASGMAALARLSGIPARVAVGYTAGQRQPDGNWLVTTADAHAWPELFFQGAGWLRFEPTPGGATGQGTAIPPSYARSANSSISGLGPGQTSPGGPAGNTGAKNPSGLPGNGRIAPRQAGGTPDPLTHHTSIPVAPIVAVVLVVLALLPRTARSVSRWRRWRSAQDPASAAHVAWRELQDDLTDHGLSWQPSDSPRAVSRRIGRMLGLSRADQEALDRITAAEEHALYARSARTPSSLRGDVTAVRRAMASEATPMARWQARLLPPSCVRPALSSLTQALDVFGWLDAAGQRMRTLGDGLRGHAR
jgi:transglutaminase-like putative cysteine protease